MTVMINPRETGFVRLDFAEVFGNRNRVVLEIGSGKGRFLIASATEQPDVNFIGIEKSLHYHRVIRDACRKRGLTQHPPHQPRRLSRPAENVCRRVDR